MKPATERELSTTTDAVRDGRECVDFAIVGAGLAGLAAARRLALTGARIVLFDKGRGPGGRASVRRSAPYSFDHGAQYFTVRDQDFERVVRAWERRGVVAPWNARVAVLPERHFAAHAVSDVQRFVGTPGMNAFAKELAAGLDVRTRIRIGPCAPTDEGWRIADVDGVDVCHAHGLLVTTPPAQALPLLAHAPAMAKVVAGTTMAPCVAVLLGFSSRVPCEFDAAFVNAGPLSWIARDSSKPARPAHEAWVLHGSKAWSRENFEGEPEALIASLRAAFAGVLGFEPPATTFEQAHRWRYALPESARRDVALHDAARGVGVAGDWLNGGRCEGAFLSGVRAAELMLKHTPAQRRAPAGGA